MVIIKIAGGLGNQMQQYALYRKLLYCGIDKDIKLDISWFFHLSQEQREIADRDLEFELPRFINLPLPICTDEEKQAFIRKRSASKVFSRLIPQLNVTFIETEMYHPEIYKLRNKYIEGYFACQKYYNDIMDELQRLFLFPEDPEKDRQKRNHELMEEMDANNSVSVHIRRGDYLKNDNRSLFGNITTEQYYESALAYFRERYSDIHFYIFSDDSEYVKARYRDKKLFTIIDHNTGRASMFDMQLMSHCHGNICANSTFSFWGARLNKYNAKEVIRPLTMRNNQICEPSVMHEYWPGWILIDRDGTIR